jgi:hypothetical protein
VNSHWEEGERDKIEQKANVVVGKRFGSKELYNKCPPSAHVAGFSAQDSTVANTLNAGKSVE